MTRYIDAEWVNHEYYKNPSYENLCHALNNAPTVDVQLVVKGEWMDKGSLSCRCSECGCKNNKETAFCPNCGAMMEGVK